MFKCVCLSVCPWGVYNFGLRGYLLVSVGVYVRVCVFIKTVCVLITPLLPGFNTFCMRRLTTLPSNHILLSGHRRQQQQVVWPIGILQSGKEGEKEIVG